MTSHNADRAWAQIPMPDWLFNAWKAYAVSIDQEQRQVLDIFVREYIDAKESSDGTKHVLFYAAVRSAKGRSVQLDANLYKKTQGFADKHETRVNRVLMTAVIDGLKNRNKIDV
ncbi:hypothetical protein [Alteromonas macleodii]|uniref:hypothetical protein n=1 Tax=Alteromonas macleodii TaxID=28108 RepID=UPI000859621C|nr:hypothetical protein [Alteromonas macleodii]